jgi:hypothetical protein
MPPVRLLAALAVCGIALAACGSSSTPSNSGSADTQALKFADCMRANGTLTFPDPGSNGKLPNPFSPAFRAAEKACAKLQPVGMQLGGPAAQNSRRIARRARVRPMHARTRALALPGSASDGSDRLGSGDPDTGPRGVLSSHRQRTQASVAGVQAGSEGLRTAASHGPAVAVPANQQEARGPAPAGGPRSGGSELYAARGRTVGRPKERLPITPNPP